ncbi:MAG TPA: hypothetical protein VGF97_13700 [Rhizomicrobium sp.]|jgi:hypothetical protein
MGRLTGYTALLALAAVSPACANTGLLSNSITPYLSSGDEVVPNVTPGDQIAIACDAVQHRPADSDVRVVLTISAMPGETSTGYAKVLATDEQILKDSVRVRIPTVPDLNDHTVDVSVYVVGDGSEHRCSAGHMKISLLKP